MANDQAEMNLHELIEKAICQVVRAVAGASLALADDKANKSAEIDPRVMAVAGLPQTSPVTNDTDRGKRKLVEIDFDRAITTSEANSNEGGGEIGVAVAVVKMNARGNKMAETSTRTANRVRFSVPILLPVAEPSGGVMLSAT
ncbi:hypothetical protein [Botrimarina mediterranea]|nr:hypothetical protein [Botrimarina mediterranea]